MRLIPPIQAGAGHDNQTGTTLAKEKDESFDCSQHTENRGWSLQASINWDNFRPRLSALQQNRLPSPHLLRRQTDRIN